VLVHARPRVEVELERRPAGILEVRARVEDELEPADGTGERRVREVDREPFELRALQASSRDRLDVYVAAQRIEVPERARPDQPCAGEPVLELALEATDQLGEVGL
jgi:hypothetical protein